MSYHVLHNLVNLALTPRTALKMGSKAAGSIRRMEERDMPHSSSKPRARITDRSGPRAQTTTLHPQTQPSLVTSPPRNPVTTTTTQQDIR